MDIPIHTELGDAASSDLDAAQLEKSMTTFLMKALMLVTGRTAGDAARAAGTKSRSSRSQRGVVLVEVLVAIAIMGSATTATLTSLSSGAITTNHTALRGTADWLVTSQANVIQESTFQATPGNYASIEVPTDYVISNTTSAVVGGDAQIQAVTITISYRAKFFLPPRF
jgi:prepilin-type N-terminal cleavage/methylation domain-containing protein